MNDVELLKKTIVKFSKVSEYSQFGKIMQEYDINLFFSDWYIIDFLIYCTKCVKNYNINLYTQDKQLVTHQYIKDNEELKATYLEDISKNNKLDIAITLFVKDSGFTITKFYEQKHLLAITNVDSNLDLYALMDQLNIQYLIYIQSEHICGVLKAYNENRIPDRLMLVSAWQLLTFMVTMPDEKYAAFYRENIAWIEKAVPNISYEKEYWNRIIERINSDLNNLN